MRTLEKDTNSSQSVVLTFLRILNMESISSETLEWKFDNMGLIFLSESRTWFSKIINCAWLGYRLSQAIMFSTSAIIIQDLKESKIQFPEMYHNYSIQEAKQPRLQQPRKRKAKPETNELRKSPPTTRLLLANLEHGFWS